MGHVSKLTHHFPIETPIFHKGGENYTFKHTRLNVYDALYKNMMALESRWGLYAFRKEKMLNCLKS